MSDRATVYGVGVVDIEISANDEVYVMWRYMIRKCFLPRGADKRYTMSEKWLRLSNFYQFVSACGGKSKSLRCDKDDHYCEAGCYFVDKKPFTRLSSKPAKRENCTCSCTCGAAKLIE